LFGLNPFRKVSDTLELSVCPPERTVTAFDPSLKNIVNVSGLPGSEESSSVPFV